MFGVIEFYIAAKDAGIKPIIGLETYVSARRMTDRDAQKDKHSYHLLLLAENETGYKNLLKIASAAQLEGFLLLSPRGSRIPGAHSRRADRHHLVHVWRSAAHHPEQGCRSRPQKCWTGTSDLWRG